MSLERIICPDRTAWLSQRTIQGIGGSEAAAIVGVSPWLTAIELWRLKTGQAQAKDLSDNEAVQRGVAMEPAIREFFKALHPTWTVEHHPYDILYQSERPFIFATLDGEITDDVGRRRVLEVKTGTTLKWNEWKDGVPTHYEMQGLHQLLATGFEIVNFIALLYRQNGDMEIVEREIWREDFEDDIALLAEKEKDFWRSVQERRPPRQVIRF